MTNDEPVRIVTVAVERLPEERVRIVYAAPQTVETPPIKIVRAAYAEPTETVRIVAVARAEKAKTMQDYLSFDDAWAAINGVRKTFCQLVNYPREGEFDLQDPYKATHTLDTVADMLINEIHALPDATREALGLSHPASYADAVKVYRANRSRINGAIVTAMEAD